MKIILSAAIFVALAATANAEWVSGHFRDGDWVSGHYRQERTDYQQWKQQREEKDSRHYYSGRKVGERRSTLGEMGRKHGEELGRLGQRLGTFSD